MRLLRTSVQLRLILQMAVFVQLIMLPTPTSRVTTVISLLLDVDIAVLCAEISIFATGAFRSLIEFGIGLEKSISS